MVTMRLCDRCKRTYGQVRWDDRLCTECNKEVYDKIHDAI